MVTGNGNKTIIVAFFLFFYADQKYLAAAGNTAFPTSTRTICFSFNFDIPIFFDNIDHCVYVRIAAVVVAYKPCWNVIGSAKH